MNLNSVQKIYDIQNQIQEIVNKNESIILLFSGGKRSLLLLHLCKVYLDSKIITIHIDTGNDWDQIKAFLKKCQILYNFSIITLHANSPTGDYDPSDNCCQQNKINPFIQWIKENSSTKILIGTSIDSQDRFSRLLLNELGNKIEMPLIHLSDEECLSYLLANGISRCSLYDKEYQKLDCIACSLKIEEKSDMDNRIDEEIMREKLQKLGYL